MTTLHLSAEDITGLVVGEDGSVTAELTAEGLRALDKLLAKRRSRSAVQIAMAPGPQPNSDTGYGVGFRHGYESGRGYGMPPMRA